MEEGSSRRLTGKSKGKIPLEKSRRRWEKHIKFDLKERGVGTGIWIK